MRIVHLSDTHGVTVPVPPGEILIHTGDFGKKGTEHDCVRFNAWMRTLPHPYKLLVPGNHDGFCETDPGLAQALMPAVRILIDQLVTIHGIRIFGTPWSLPYKNWSFMKSEQDLARLTARWPETIDILASHGPAYNTVDNVSYGTPKRAQPVGSRALRRYIDRVQPRLVLTGHIHEHYGRLDDAGITFLNSTILSTPLRTPQIIDWNT